MGVPRGHLGGHAAGHVIAERDKIDGRLKYLTIGIRDIQLNIILTKEPQHIAWINTTALNIAKKLPFPVLLQRFQPDAEIRFAVERMRYNERVQAYNTSRRQFPSNITAGIFGFKEYPLFNAPPEAERVPKVDFGRQS